MKDTNEPCQKSADNISVAWGAENIEIQLSAPVDVVDIELNKEPLSGEQIINVLEEEAVYSYGLNEVVEDAKKILLVLPDATRKSGAELILPYVVEKIIEHGKEFHMVVAVGTHRQPTEDELQTIFTPEIYNQHKDKLIVHDSDNYDDHDFYGKSKRKTTVLINKAYREHDTIITLGSVSYHYFAGYGGGRKLIMPGLASKKTIMANHKLALNIATGQRHDKAVIGNMKHNPVHDDIVECIMIARATHTFFAINTLLDNEGRVIDMTCGDLFMSHIKAAELLDDMSAVKAEKYDTLFLSAGGAPKDINMVQAQKSLDRVKPMLADGAKVFFFAKCPDGYGNDFFKEFFDVGSADAMLASLLDDYQINRQTAYNLKAILEKYDVYLYSDFTKEESERMGFKKLESVEQALEQVAGKCCFVPHAYNIYPKEDM